MGETGDTSVLVVDDEDSLRHILRTLLAAHGCDVRSAATGEEATEILSEWNPDVALVDIIMPGKSTGVYSVVGAGVVLYDDVADREMVTLRQKLDRRSWGPEQYGW